MGGSLIGMNETTQELPPEPQEPRRLLRARSGRMIGGVCAGLGRYFNVDPILFRIGAVVLTFVGGAGVLAYLAALLLVPSEDSAAAETPATGRNRWLVIAGVVVLLCVSWPFLLGGGLLLAATSRPTRLSGRRRCTRLVVRLRRGTRGRRRRRGEAGRARHRDPRRLRTDRDRRRVGGRRGWRDGRRDRRDRGRRGDPRRARSSDPMRWLVLPAVTLALSAGAVSASGIDLDGGVGERDYRPASVTDLRETYELGIGELIVDLRHTDLPPGDVPMAIDLGIGEARVIVPDDVCVATDAEVGIGEVRSFDRTSEGVDVDFEDRPDVDGDVTRLVVEADVGLGALRIGRSGTDLDLDHGHIDFGPQHDGDLGRNLACAA